MTREPLVKVHDLRVKRGRFTLELPTWTLAPGEVIGLVGPNGAGKTTLLEALAGMRARHGGEVAVLGHDPWRTPEKARRELGFMSDDMPLFDLKIHQLLYTISGYYPSWDDTLVRDLLERFRLDPEERATRLSRGQGTRLRLITALAFRPKVLLLDEPAAGLDLGGRRRLIESVLEVVDDAERSVVISSHLLADVERIADRLLVINEGRVIQEGPTDSLVGEERTLEEALLAWGAAE